MGAVVLLLLLAVLLGFIGIGQGLWWLILIAVGLVVFGAFSGTRFRR